MTAGCFYLEQETPQYLDADHVAALVAAGEDVPAEVLRKFAEVLK